MAKIRLEIDDQAAATMHELVVQMRKLEQTRQDLQLDGRLRDVELALAGSLRAHGWHPVPGVAAWRQFGGKL